MPKKKTLDQLQANQLNLEDVKSKGGCCSVLKSTTTTTPDTRSTPVADKDLFSPVLGELVGDDAFAFVLLSCHC